MAEALGQKAAQPLEMPTMPGVKISPYAGLAKIFDEYIAGRDERAAKEESKALGEKYQKDISADYSSLLKGLTPTAAVPEGAPTYMPNVDQRDVAENSRMVMQPERNEMGEIIAAGQPGAGNFGVTPGAPAIPATTGKLTAEGFSAMQTPEGRQLFMAQLLAQNKPKDPIKLGKDDVLLDPDTKKTIYKPEARANFGSINPSQYTPESVRAFAASGGTDFSLLRTPPVAKAGRTGDLGVYDEYVTQETKAGRIPLGIDKFLLNQKIAARPPAAVRERFVYDANRGGRVNLDTGELLPVTQGGQPIGGKERPLSTGEVDKITAIDVSSGTQKRLNDTFQDSYGGYTLKAGGEIANVLGAKFGGDNEAQAQWWASHEANDNVTRNLLFGASLTAGEQKAWERTTINPGMSPSMIRARMTERQALIDAKRSTTVGNLEKAGFDVKGFKEKSNAFETSAGKVTTLQEIQDVATRTGKTVEQVTKDAVAQGYKVQ
jgi:hypothetical protein